MSKPYVNELNASYASPTFSINIEYLKLRGGGTFSITGVSSSTVLINVNNSFSTNSKDVQFNQPLFDVNGSTFSINIGTLNGSITSGAVQLGTSSHYIYNGVVGFYKLDSAGNSYIDGNTDTFTFSA